MANTKDSHARTTKYGGVEACPEAELPWERITLRRYIQNRYALSDVVDARTKTGDRVIADSREMTTPHQMNESNRYVSGGRQGEPLQPS